MNPFSMPRRRFCSVMVSQSLTTVVSEEAVLRPVLQSEGPGLGCRRVLKGWTTCDVIWPTRYE